MIRRVMQEAGKSTSSGARAVDSAWSVSFDDALWYGFRV